MATKTKKSPKTKPQPKSRPNRAKANAPSVIVLRDSAADGIPLYSPFTGIATFGDDAYESEGHPDPSLVFAFVGDAGEFLFVRDEVQSVVKEFSGSDVAAIKRQAEATSARLTKAGLQTLTFVSEGGWNGINVVCYEVGYLADDEWCGLGE